MAIKLRTVKGTPLTSVEYDEAISQLIYSASTEGANSAKTLHLHFTGSAGLSYSPRTIEIPIPEYTYWAISDGSNTETIYNTGTVIFSGSSGVTTTYTPATNKLNVDHDTVSLTSNTSNTSPQAGQTFTAIDSITTNAGGHVTALNTKTVTLPVSASYALTASYALNSDGGGVTSYTELTDIPANIISGSTQIANLGFLTSSSLGLNTKVGNVPSSSFQATGSNDSFFDVTFATPFSSSNYSVALTNNGLFGDVYAENKTPTGFRLVSTYPTTGWALYPGTSVDYVAIAQGETAVTSSFTELAATASHALTASYSTNDIVSQQITVNSGTASLERTLLLPDGIEYIDEFVFAAGGGLTRFGTTYPYPGRVPYCTSINFPSTLRYIASGGFSGQGIEELNFPSSLEYIGPSAFYDVPTRIISCSNSIKNIGDYAFYRNVSTNISSLPFLESLHLNEGLETIGTYAFRQYNDKLFNSTGSINLTIPSSVISIGDYAFENHRLASLSFAPRTSSLTIGRAAFSGTSPYVITEDTGSFNFIDSITVPDNTTLEYGCFQNLRLTYFELGESCSLDGAIVNPNRYGLSKLQTLILRPYTDIRTSYGSSNATFRNTDFGDIIFSGSEFNRIPAYTFYVSIFDECPTVSNPNITTVGGSAFPDSSFRTSSVDFTGITTIEGYAFSNSSYSSAYTGYRGFTSVTFGNNTVISASAFYRNRLTELSIGENCDFHPTYIYTNPQNSTNTGIFANNSGSIQTLTIPGSTLLGTASFANTGARTYTSTQEDGIRDLIFSGSGRLTSIPHSSFQRCGIQTVTFNGTSIDTIGPFAFYYNEITSSIIIPSTVTYIGNSAFSNNNIPSASLPSGIQSGSSVFASNPGIVITYY